MSEQTAVTTKQFSKNGSYTVSYTSEAQLDAALMFINDRLDAEGVVAAHAPACTCLKCQPEPLPLQVYNAVVSNNRLHVAEAKAMASQPGAIKGAYSASHRLFRAADGREFRIKPDFQAIEIL